MNLHQIIRDAKLLVSDNSPAILTGIGVAGTITTAVLTGRAAYNIGDLHRMDEVYSINPITRKRTYFQQEQLADLKTKVRWAWPFFVPPAIVGVGTITSIVFANRIGSRRAAAVAAAYTISERAFSEYKEKVVDHIGKEKERKVRDEIAQDRVNRSDAPKGVLVVSNGDDVLCHDAWSNQYFHSDMETIRKAVNDINAQILHSDFATITDFYHAINSDMLEQTDGSSDFGWNTDKLLEVEYTTTLYREKTPCLSISFATMPIQNPWRYV